jgi:hypothetical protein
VVAFVHDTAAGEHRDYLQIDPNSGLSLGDVPWTYGAAFRATHAPDFVDGNSAFVIFFYDPEWTQSRAGGRVAMHAPALNIKVMDPAFMLNIHPLDISPVVRCEGGLKSAFWPPVFVFLLGPVIPYILVLNIRVSGFILLLAG